MTLSKRERTIAITTGALIGVFMLWQFVFSPLLDSDNSLNDQLAQANLDLNNDLHTISRSSIEKRQWKTMSGSYVKAKDDDAEQQVLNSVQGWAQESGVALPAIKPDRREEQLKYFNQITFHATATGTMAQLTRFMYRIQAAPIPVRVTDFQITSRKEGTDDLSLQIGISTIQLLPQTTGSGATGSAAPAAAQEVGP